MKIRAIAVIISLLFLPLVAAAQNSVRPVDKLTYDSSTGEIVYGKNRYKMVKVEGGSFSMGATPEQVNPERYEKPVHRVTLSNYFIGKIEVPQWLWVAVMGSNPSDWKGDNLPVDNVSWYDCQTFLVKLNKLTSMHFTLPTEAQWEFAARGGNHSRGYQYSGSDDLGAVAWYEDNSNWSPHEGGLKEPNELGLFDMSGNVYEWCHDWVGPYPDHSVTNPKGTPSGSRRAFRGGCLGDSLWYCRVAIRGFGPPDCNHDGIGFRLALDAASNQETAAQTVAPKLTYDSSTQEIVYGEHRYKMVKVEGGSFDMGATPEQVDPWDEEKPVHRVTLSSYSIGQTEVPQWLWKAVMGSNPSYFEGDNLPVEQVSWDYCQEFLSKLNNLTGMRFSLPTEAQWEFAARGGNRSRGYQYSGSDDLGAVAWYKDNSNSCTHEVGLKGSNELGLYDMSGNVWEWCHDWYDVYPDYSVTNPKGVSSGSSRMCRGGGWGNKPEICRVAMRYGIMPIDIHSILGFRLALDAASNQETAAQTAAPKLSYDSSTQEIVYGEHRYKMVKVEGGTFFMAEDTSEQVDAVPAYRVTLSSYFIGQTEVPQWLWVAVMGNNPSYFKGDNLPVEQVSWNDCQEFLEKLNNLIGMHFSLPTEAQWEFAARGGNRSRVYQYSGGDDLGAVAWYGENSDYRTHDVGLKKSNELGLYDMSGNVWEWCQDWYGDYSEYSDTDPTGASSGSNRVNRGGSWYDTPWESRVAYRNYSTPDNRDCYLGFRLAL